MRASTSAIGPSTGTATRMNKKAAPQTAATVRSAPNWRNVSVELLGGPAIAMTVRSLSQERPPRASLCYLLFVFLAVARLTVALARPLTAPPADYAAEAALPTADSAELLA